MEVLFVTAESYPFMKVGGLGDVSYALPKNLIEMGVDIRVIMPKYRFPKKIKRKMKKIAHFTTYIGWKTVDCNLFTIKSEGVQYYFIDNPFYFYRTNAYGYHDDHERFIFFSKAVLEGIKYMGDFKPNILHCNDWHSALVIPLKSTYYLGNTIYDNIRTIFTIHNILYQGVYGKDILWMLGLDESKYFTDSTLKYYEGISFMKWAILTADRITTVSKTYSEEIREPELGYGLNNILEKRKQLLSGIQNGIDYEVFDPAADRDIYFNYDLYNLDNKYKNKLKVQEELSFKVDKEIPLISMITRLTDQKGVGLLEGIVGQLMELDIQLIIIGTGEDHYEQDLRYFSKKYNNKFRAVIEFNETLSKKIYSASDMFLMPSKFEPCGLSQLIAMRYGTVPIVRSTGGLKDTVIDYSEYTGEGDGFTFKGYDALEFYNVIKRAVDIFNRDKVLWKKLCTRIMSKDNSWKVSSYKYKRLYEKLI
jgi:starch synthase